MQRPQKITFGEMHESGVCGVLILLLRLQMQPLPDLSRVTSARLAASVALISGQIFSGWDKPGSLTKEF
jgi:hypothetical protein